MHAACEFISGRPWRCAAMLALAVAFKPVAIIMLLLMFVLYREVRLPLVIAVAVVLLLPMLRPDPNFAWAEYRSFLDKISVAATPSPGAWPWLADIATLLNAFGFTIGLAGLFVIRAFAAAATLFVAWRGKVLLSRSWSVCTALALSLTYLTLFNPRTESDAYVALTPMFGLCAGLLIAKKPGSALGWLLFGAAFAVGIPWGTSTDPWLKPMLGLTFILCWSWMVFDTPWRKRLNAGAAQSEI
jgi:alpha-1,2-mannosyltransferase